MKRLMVSTKIREKLLASHHGECPSCRATDVPLELCHIVPIRHGEETTRENLVVLCRNCHHLMDAAVPTEDEFVRFLADELLAKHPLYRFVRSEVAIEGTPRLRADLMVERKSGDTWTPLLIECKNLGFMSRRLIHRVVAQIKYYRDAISHEYGFALALLGRFTDEDRELLRASRVDAWDVDFIARTFSEQISSAQHSYFVPLLRAILGQGSTDECRDLLTDLRACKPGMDHWVVFQRLVGRILEQLFCPPLETPIPQSSDQHKVNRRDWVLPNYAPEGLWNFLRARYRADYIVVDAKNFKGRIKKNDVLQVANYLKLHGAGLFGAIVCRRGADKGSITTLREQWMANEKMIIVITDREIEEMLLAASAGRKPEAVIARIIEEFRLSI